MTSLAFSKLEHLKSKVRIGQLFKEGKSFSKYPIRVVWLEQKEVHSTAFPAQMALTVPKKNFKKAVDRNRLRRQIREAYRLNKSILYQRLTEADKSISLMFIYVGKEATSYQKIERSMIKILNQIE